MVAASLLIFVALQCPPPADYQPGISKDGWAVAPADVPSENDAFSDVQLDLDMPASNYSNNPLLKEHFPYAELQIGEANISQDGSVSLNGVPYHPAECED